MSTKNDGGPAFPLHGDQDFAEVGQNVTGMTLRDWFAGQALVAAIPACANDQGALEELARTGSPSPYFARRAFEVADAMLAEREK